VHRPCADARSSRLDGAPVSEPTVPDPDTASAGDAPPAGVLDELHAAFGGDPADTSARPPAASQPPSAPADQPSSRPGETSHSIIAESLVPEATRRSLRRSRREAKREAKRQAKRVAAREKDDRRLAKQARKAAKKARKSAPDKSQHQPDLDVIDASGGDDNVDVRIIENPSTAPATPAEPAPPAGPSPARPTVAIEDDGSPDAVYVEGELGEGGSATVLTGLAGERRSTVFIDDRGPGTGELVTIDVATSAARMEPRMRERRIAVKRAVGRKRLKWIAIGAAAVGVVVAALGVLGSGLFAISRVEVDGAVYSQGEALDAVVEELDGANVLRVDTTSAERALEAIPWVEDARVSTDFPHGASIEIRERRPMVTYLAGDGRYRVLDRTGRVLDVIAGRPVAYLELNVDDGPELESGQLAPAGYRAAATLVSALTPQMRQRATSVSVDQNAMELSLMLDDEIEVRFGAAEDLLDKLVRLQTALTNPNPELTATELIDVSTEDMIVR
jgi:cell division septal protein FtsQ